MRLQLAKWGNSLAVRLPVECTRAAGLREGDTLEAEVTPVGAALHAALFDAQVREARRAAQAAYRDQLAALPSGVDRLLEVSAPAPRG